jgi:hypothetical protein
VTFNKSWTKYLKTFGIKIQKVKPAKLKGQKATFTVSGGEMDPTNGLGTLTLSGGLKFKAGKKSATVKGLVLSTAQNKLTGKVSGKKVTLAKLSGLSFSRVGFGVKVNLKKLKLQGAAAKQLNKKLGYAKGKPKPFIANKLIGKAAAEDQPSTVAVLPANNMVFTGDATLLGKLKDVEANVETIAPTTQVANVFTSPITGGTIAPTATAGTVMSSGGLKLVQKLFMGPSTTITLGSMYLDLAAKTVTVEVIAESDAESPSGSGKKPLNLGNLGRSSIADLTVTGVSADPTTRTVSVNSSAVLQPISAEVLEGFVQVYQGYLTVALQGPPSFLTEEQAKEAAAKKVEKDHIKAGESLGTFAFTAQTQ